MVKNSWSQPERGRESTVEKIFKTGGFGLGTGVKESVRELWIVRVANRRIGRQGDRLTGIGRGESMRD